MWKSKPFLKGLGIGLISAAILLQLMLTVKHADAGISNPEPAKVQSEDPALDSEAIKKKAEAAGLQVFDKDAKLYTQEQLDDAVRKAAETAKPPEQAQAVPSKQVTIYINEGMSAVNVADYLYRSGIIHDRTAFQNELTGKSLESKIRSSVYTFNLNESMTEVIRKLTTPPSWEKKQE